MNIDPNKIRFFYLRDENKFPVACIASVLLTTSSGQFIAFAVSTHNPVDRYDRKYAKFLAQARLVAQECMVVEAGKGARERVAKRIANNPYMPFRTQAAARLYLRSVPKVWGPLEVARKNMQALLSVGQTVFPQLHWGPRC